MSQFILLLFITLLIINNATKHLKIPHEQSNHNNNILNKNDYTKTMLCVFFINFSHDWAIHYLKRNIFYAGSYCNSWLLQPYLPTSPTMIAAINKHNHSLHTIALKHNTTVNYALHDTSIYSENQTCLYKACLYTNLIPYLTNTNYVYHTYERIWLIDEDFTFEGLNFNEYFNYLDKPNSPLSYTLLSQPLILGNSYFKYLTYNFGLWVENRKNEKRVSGTQNENTLIAVSTDIIEIQAPIINIQYFLYYLYTIRIPILPLLNNNTMEKCHYFGFTRTWCDVAYDYLVKEKGQNYVVYYIMYIVAYNVCMYVCILLRI